MTIPGLNIYVEGGPHGDVKIVLNRKGFNALKRVVGSAAMHELGDQIYDDFFDSNGEGFELTIEVKDDESFLALKPQWSEEMRNG